MPPAITSQSDKGLNDESQEMMRKQEEAATIVRAVSQSAIENSFPIFRAAGSLAWPHVCGGRPSPTGGPRRNPHYD